MTFDEYLAKEPGMSDPVERARFTVALAPLTFAVHSDIDQGSERYSVLCRMVQDAFVAGLRCAVVNRDESAAWLARRALEDGA